MRKSSYSALSLFIRSSLFLICSTTSMAVYSFLCLLSLPFPLRFRFAVIRVYLRFYFYMLEHICHIHHHIEGLDNIPKDRVGVILSKHQSTWETLFLPLVFNEPAIILKRELMWLPFFGWGLAVSDPIAINRNDKTSAMQQIIIKGKKCLQSGRWVLVFPEGTRTPIGQVGQYKLGGTRLAVATGYPILPVAHDAGRYWPRRKFIKHPGTVRMVIGPLIETQGLTPEAALELAKNWIEGTMTHIDGLVNESAR